MSLLGIKILSGNVASTKEGELSEGVAGVSLSCLPCMPQVLNAVLDRACMDDVSFSELAEIISLDPGLCTRILVATADESTAQLLSLSQQLNKLGLEKLQELVRQTAFQQFLHAGTAFNDADMQEYWQHSIISAANARRIARLVNYEFIEQAWLAGLLHDIGRLALGTVAAGFSQIGKILANEIEIHATTHAARGADILAAWSARSFLPDAIRYHHTEASLLQEAHILVRIVHVASQLGQKATEAADSRLAESAALLGLDQETLRELARQAGHELERLQRQSMVDISAQETRAGSQKLEQLVKRQALLYGHLSGLFGLNNIDQVSQGLLQCVQRLFVPRSAMLFSVEGTGQMRGSAALGCNSRMLREIAFTLSGSTGFVLRAVNDREMISANSNDSEARQSVLDNQLLSILATEKFLCLPLFHGINPAGVLLLGIELGMPDILDNDRELLMLFSCEAGRILGQLADRPVTGKQISQPDIREEARKLVHEVSNPLTVIMNYLAVLSAKIGKSHIARDDVRIITEEIERVNDIVRQFADGMPKRDNRMVDINAVVQDMVRAMKEGMPGASQVTITLDLDNTMTTVATNRDMLKQIMINMLKNAIEAVEPEGGVRIRTRGRVRMDNIDYVEIAVIDNGSGIPDTIYSQLFQPVESTKGMSHSGLGLSIVYRLVSELSGKISCRTTKGKGTVFHILLPINPL